MVALSPLIARQAYFRLSSNVLYFAVVTIIDTRVQCTPSAKQIHQLPAEFDLFNYASYRSYRFW